MEIHRERFEAWLDSQPDERVIEATHTKQCFLCSFLKETAQVRNPVFGWDDWYDDTKHLQPIPAWALQLISRNWLKAQSNDLCVFITVGQMKRRYRELFPETEVSEQPVVSSDKRISEVKQV